MASSHHFTHPRQVSARLVPPLYCTIPLPLPLRARPYGRVYYPSIGLVVVHIRIFCDHLNVHFFDPTCIVLESGWNYGANAAPRRWSAINSPPGRTPLDAAA